MAKNLVEKMEIKVDMTATERMNNALNEVKRILKAKDKSGLDIALVTLDKEIADQNKLIRHDYFAQFLKAGEDAMAQAILQLELLQFSLIRTTVTADNGVKSLTDVAFNSQKLIRIDIAEFINYAKGKEIGVTHSVNFDGYTEALKYYISAYYAQSVKAPFDGAGFKYDPSNDSWHEKELSKNTMKSLMEKLINSLIYIDNGKGKNAVKPFSIDVEYLSLGCGKLGKAKHIVCPKTSTVYSVMADVMNRILTGGSYECDYDKEKKSAK